MIEFQWTVTTNLIGLILVPVLSTTTTIIAINNNNNNEGQKTVFTNIEEFSQPVITDSMDNHYGVNGWLCWMLQPQ